MEPEKILSTTAGVKSPNGGGRRAAALKASTYEMLGFGAGQVFRLGSNLILTRLLMPEAFGLSAMVAIFSQGLTMLSDVGIAASVVRSPDGDEPDFLNTAWTITAIRGCGLYLVALALAWPVSWLYQEPQLGPLLAVGSGGVLINGFTSTSLLTLRRQMNSKATTLLELTSQLVGLVTIIGAAYVTRSVWALIAGTHVSTLYRVLMSHYFIDVGYRNRFHWSKTASQSIVHFGRWIFFSSACQFGAQQFDRMYLGRVAGMAELGVYNVAATLSDVGNVIVVRITHQVLYPALSAVFRESPKRLSSAYYKARLLLDAVVLPIAGAGMVLAPNLIHLLYTDRYADAGWILRVLLLRVALSAILTPCESCLFAAGHSQSGFVRSVIRLIFAVIGMPIAGHFWGTMGVIWVTAFADLPSTIAILHRFRRAGLLVWYRELLVPVFFSAGAGVAWLLLICWNYFAG